MAEADPADRVAPHSPSVGAARFHGIGHLGQETLSFLATTTVAGIENPHDPAHSATHLVIDSFDSPDGEARVEATGELGCSCPDFPSPGLVGGEGEDGIRQCIRVFAV